MHSAVPVAVTGWSTSSILLALLNALIGTGAAGALAVWIKTRPKMREISQSGEEKLIGSLMGRVQKLEADLALLTDQREIERARHEAEISIMRHRVNNSDQCLDALLLLLKTSPDKVSEAIGHIEVMRERQKQEVAAEKGAQTGARVAAAEQAASSPPDRREAIDRPL